MHEQYLSHSKEANDVTYLSDRQLNCFLTIGRGLKINKYSPKDTAYQFSILTHKQLEMHGCVIFIMATNELVLKHYTISTQSAD